MHWLDGFQAHLFLFFVGVVNIILILIFLRPRYRETHDEANVVPCWFNFSYTLVLICHTVATLYRSGSLTVWFKRPCARLELFTMCIKITSGVSLLYLVYAPIDNMDIRGILILLVGVVLLCSPRFLLLTYFIFWVGRIRTIVSQNKRRLVEDGYDLDMSYITPRIVAMGYPADGDEICFRNAMPDVQKFLDSRHPENYKVYNLCAEKERDYSIDSFDSVAHDIVFPDHNPCPLDDLCELVEDQHLYLAADAAHTVVVHCKAGKGRTGMVIACLLLREGNATRPSEALRIFSDQRTKDGKGVTIPSQIRYVGLYATFLREGRLRHRAVKLLEVRMAKIRSSPGLCAGLRLSICLPDGRTLPEQLGHREFGNGIESDQAVVDDNGDIAVVLRDCESSDSGWFLEGDFNVIIKHTPHTAWPCPVEKVLFSFWLHSAYVPLKQELKLHELDRIKGQESKFHSGFAVTCIFSDASL